MAANWTNIRIQRETADQLLRVLARLETQASAARSILPIALSDERSWDFAIRLLIERNERHVARGRRQSSAKGAPGAANVRQSD